MGRHVPVQQHQKGGLVVDFDLDIGLSAEDQRVQVKHALFFFVFGIKVFVVELQQPFDAHFKVGRLVGPEMKDLFADVGAADTVVDDHASVIVSQFGEGDLKNVP